MNKKTSNSYPRLSIRLSDDQRLEIETRAQNAGLTMGGYCKTVIFKTPAPRRSRRPVPEKAELSKLLGHVSRVGSNVNQISRQLNMYSAIDIVEVKNALSDVAELRAAIMKALGYTEKLSDLFPKKSTDRYDY
ncbi:MAG: plasmid mobilization relaxosome protein MobC [Gammaproteobacteria bacterium]|nr:MAG: plasmid mobilization relaxosome protein MobC [Gammaproteobacteria bacterium]